MVLMFQAEVAQRLRADPDTRAWGSLSIWIQNRWNVRKLISVKPGAFNPPPKVDSEVLVFERREQPRIQIPNDPKTEAQWESLLKATFSQRRKMLRSVLKPYPVLRNALELSQVDDTKRAEALSWEEWAKLWECLSKA